jgi:pilus assembly protein FimV
VKPAEPAKPAEAPKTATPPPADTKLADASKATPPKTEPSKTEPPKTEPPKVAEAPKADSTKPAPPKPATPPKTDTTKVAKKGPPPEKSLTEELLDNPWMLMAGVGGLAALGIGGLLFMRRRRERAEGTSSEMVSAFPSDLKADSTTGKAGGGLVDTGNSSFLTDFDKTGPGSIDTDEVDPVAEAEVYIAYGRDAQAEEILKEAMARDKSRHEIPLKLLEIYHARKSATAFETVAKELRSQVGESSPIWQKAAAMGAQIDPGNSLYGAAAAGTATYTAMAPSAPAPKPDVDFDIAGSSAASSAPAPDFDLDLDGKKDAPAASSGMDFDLDAPSTPAPAAEPAKEEKPAFDFDLSGLDFPGSKPAGGTDLDVDPTRNATSASSMDLADLSLDSSDAGGGEAVGTKLELAKAYLEIGDKDGAREILQEVAKEGSAAQKDEAQKLISSL